MSPDGPSHDRRDTSASTAAKLPGVGVESAAGPPAPQAIDSSELVGWMIRYQQGSLEAFDRLYVQLARRLEPYLARHAGYSAGELGDLLQETFLQIHRSRHTYLPPRPVEPWAFGIARHVVLMSRRTRRRRAARETGVERPPEPAAPAGLEETLALGQRLGRALNETTRERRGALLLHHLWGLSFREVGRLLSIRASAAKLRASRGRADLRRALGEQEEGKDDP